MKTKVKSVWSVRTRKLFYKVKCGLSSSKLGFVDSVDKIYDFMRKRGERETEKYQIRLLKPLKSHGRKIL